jgi:Xaa-Pro dipeptidase
MLITMCNVLIQFPVSGKFTADQAAVYQGVLNAQRVVFEMARPGVLWSDCHLAAEREVLKALIALGVVVGDLDAAQNAGVGAIFLPHGLGHLIGCDTHDVGG